MKMAILLFKAARIVASAVRFLDATYTSQQSCDSQVSSPGALKASAVLQEEGRMPNQKAEQSHSLGRNER